MKHLPLKQNSSPVHLMDTDNVYDKKHNKYQEEINSDVIEKIEKVEQIESSIGKSNGIASLDENGKLLESQLPNLKTINGQSITGDGNITIDLTLVKIVSSLPTSNIEENKIYFVKSDVPGEDNIYIEYMYVNGKWEKFGEYKINIDLNDYITKEDIKEIQEHLDNCCSWYKLGDVVKKEDSVATDIVFWTGSEKKIIKRSADLQKYKDKGWIPIGIMVIPPSHDVYGTGEGAMMSLKLMNKDNPDNGTNAASGLAFGNYQVNLNLPNMKTYPIIDDLGNIININNFAYIASDKYQNNKTALDNNRGYTSSSNRAPSPFLTNGDRNHNYYKNDNNDNINLLSNALSDFNGAENTKLLLETATKQSDWKTDITIKNLSDAGYSPAACCCWRYHTEGTKQGDWYLPAIGELGYMYANFNIIKTTEQIINSIYGSNIAYEMLNSIDIMSSTEYDEQSINIIYTSSTNSYNHGYKINMYYCFAFCRV